MKPLSVENSIQILTVIAVAVGLRLVVWELQQAKSLATVDVVHRNVDYSTQGHTSVFGEDLSKVFAIACFEPDDLNRSGAFVLDAYFKFNLNYVNRLEVQVDVAEYATDWK